MSGYRLFPRLDVHGHGCGEVTWTPTGGELGPADRRPDRVPGTLALEAMAQCGGMVLGREEGDRWLLVGVDGCTVEALVWDRPLVVRAEVTRRGAAACRLGASVHDGEREVAAARLLMARLRVP